MPRSSRPAFSVIIPTYSGVDTIRYAFASIASQKAQVNYELIIVIDGPNEELNHIAQEAKTEFAQKGVKTIVKQLEKNRGRFETRLAGAKTANADQLLFIDDRVRLGDNFFSYIMRSDEKVIMPNVIELETTNPISLTVNTMRRRIWGKKWGTKFADYYIDSKNFENSPKGTTSLYVDKDTFLAACREVKKDLKQTDSKRISDDTKLLRQIVAGSTRIFRTGKLNVYYLPRNSFNEAWHHLYRRGPLFVDYYYKPSTRFFPLLVANYVALAVIIATAIIMPAWLAYYVAGFVVLIVITAAAIAKNFHEYAIVLIGLPIAILTFSAGVIAGTFLKIIQK